MATAARPKRRRLSTDQRLGSGGTGPSLLSLSQDLVAPSLSSALLGPSLCCVSQSPIA